MSRRNRVSQERVSAGKGDRVRAKVLTHREFDPALNCLVVKSRKIMRVLGSYHGKIEQSQLHIDK